jgi:hypothetical protein
LGFFAYIPFWGLDIALPVSTSSETFSRFLSNEKFTKLFANEHLNEAMQFYQYVKTLYITEPKRVISSPLSFSEFTTLSELLLKHFDFQPLENPFHITDTQMMVHSPVLKYLRFHV